MKSTANSIGVPCAAVNEGRKAVLDMHHRKRDGEDSITVELIKDGGDIIPGKLSVLYTRLKTIMY